jgi:hypothetical protein
MLFAESFGGGMSVGMGAGIGAGIAIGVSSGQKSATEKLRKHFAENGLTVHDRMGKEVDLETALSTATSNQGACCGWGVTIGILLLALLAAGGGIVYALLYF